MPNYSDSQSRTLNEKMGETPSVLDWIPAAQHAAIAAGTSTYDAAADIQKAIDALKTGNGGMGLALPSGSYVIGTPLKVYMGTRLVGASSWVKRGASQWSGATLVQAPGANCDLIISGHDPNFTADDNWLHATVLQDLHLYGDRTTNTRGSGLNLYRLGENSEIRRVAAYGFPRHGIRVYDYAAPARIDMVSVHNNGSWIICTADAGANTFGATAHGLQNGERIKIKSIGGSVPGGITAWREYWVVGVTADTFQVSLTAGGAAVDITSAGSGTILALAGCGLSFEASLNSHNSIGMVSGDNNAKALIEVFGGYKNSTYIQGIKAERTNSGLTPYPGNDVVVSCLNLNTGAVSIGSLNCYASESGGRALIHNDNDGASATGPVHVIGACTFNPAGSETNYTYGYEHRGEAIGITVAEWCGGPRHPEMEMYWADRIVRALRMRSEYSAITLEGASLANPNPVVLNAVNFGDPAQGGFISVNSRYGGYPNWSKLSSHTSNDAMFVRLGAQTFEVRFGIATNTEGVDPGTSALKVDATRATVNGEMKVDCRTKGGYPLVGYIDEAKNALIVQEAEQPFGLEFYKNVSGGSFNVDWQAVVPAGAKSLRFYSDGTEKADLDTTGIFSVPNAFKVNGRHIYCGATGPEGVYGAEPGSLFLRTDGTFWLKRTASDASGWIQVGGGEITGESLTVDDDTPWIRLKKSGVLKFEVDQDGNISKLTAVTQPLLVKSDTGNVEIQTAGGVTKFKADASGNVVAEGDVTLNARTASRPLRTDSSKKITTGQVDLSNLNDVTAGSMTNGQVASWNGSYLIGLNIGTGSSDVAAGNHNHSGVYADASHSHTLTLSTATINYKDHAGNNQSLSVVTNVGIV